MAVDQELLDILRCPYCVSGPTPKPGDDPGRLELVRDGTWLVCQEADCGRKYPIKEDIPVMLIDEGDKWINTAVEELPEPGPLVEPGLISQASDSVQEQFGHATNKRVWLGLILGILGSTLLIIFLIWLTRRDS